MNNEITLLLAKASAQLRDRSQSMVRASEQLELLREWFAETNDFLEKCRMMPEIAGSKMKCPLPLIPSSPAHNAMLAILAVAVSAVPDEEADSDVRSV